MLGSTLSYEKQWSWDTKFIWFVSFVYEDEHKRLTKVFGRLEVGVGWKQGYRMRVPSNSGTCTLHSKTTWDT